MMDVSNIFGFGQMAVWLRLKCWIKFENKNDLIQSLIFVKKNKLLWVSTFLWDLIGTWIKLECLIKTFNGLSSEYAKWICTVFILF